MKNPFSKLTLFASLVAIVCTLVVANLRAASPADKAPKKSKKEAADLAKYDKNYNGKLDPDEVAAMKADSYKEKTEKKTKVDKK